MQARHTVMIGISMALMGALLVWLGHKDSATAPLSPPVATASVAVQAQPPAAAVVEHSAAPAQAKSEIATLPADEAIGTVRSSIHFERPANGTTTAANIDVNARYAVGAWRPAQRRLRIVLMENKPGPAESASMLNLLTSADAIATPAQPSAVIDLYFIPTAQAFDRSEVESATLTALGTRGETSAADVLNTLDWQGSLPSPQARGAPAVTRLQISASGNAESPDRDSWHQRWQFDVEVSVSLVEP